MKPTGLLLTAFLTTSACSFALAFTDDPPAIVAPAIVAPAIVAPAIVAPGAIDSAAEDVVVEVSPPDTVTSWQRLTWFGEKTFGISNLGGSIPGAALQTIRDRPREAGPHWEGFGQRYGVALSTNAVSNAMEAGLGAIWGEDPRYLRDGAAVPFKSRLGHVVKWTVAAPNRNGELRPAYARFIAFSGSSFISNAWREPSDTDVEHSVSRIGLALLGRMSSNAYDEFWPDVRRKLFHRGTRD